MKEVELKCPKCGSKETRLMPACADSAECRMCKASIKIEMKCNMECKKECKKEEPKKEEPKKPEPKKEELDLNNDGKVDEKDLMEMAKKIEEKKPSKKKKKKGMFS